MVQTSVQFKSATSRDLQGWWRSSSVCSEAGVYKAADQVRLNTSACRTFQVFIRKHFRNPPYY